MKGVEIIKPSGDSRRVAHVNCPGLDSSTTRATGYRGLSDPFAIATD
ncbi:hypothetical protein L810_4481 [Burkholderia sp. AU4i]|nr:hypothetical protein L810_4481 [Burkholderia sp. AU4i]